MRRMGSERGYDEGGKYRQESEVQRKGLGKEKVKLINGMGKGKGLGWVDEGCGVDGGLDAIVGREVDECDL
jgi:hypothetical protein